MIFGETAPKYWEMGIPVIPLHYHDKRPIHNDWSRFHDTLPTEDQQTAWLKHHANCNIGVVLGQQSRMCVIDIDSDDPEIIKMILEVLPPSPWQRVGKKGMVLAFKWNGINTFRIKDVYGKTLVEMLSTKTQVVLPPSIHPETKRAYTCNVELTDVIDQLTPLNREIENVLRSMFKDKGIELSYSGWTRVTDWVPQGARDVQMTKVAGHYAYGTMRGELPVLEAIERMKAWYATCTEKVAGDDVDVGKGINNLINFIVRDVTEKKKVLPRGWDEGLSDEDKTRMGLVFDIDQEEWDFVQMKEHLHRTFEEFPADHPQRTTAVMYILQKISDSTRISRLEEDQLLRYIAAVSGMNVSLSSLRGQIKEMQKGETQGSDHTEIAKAVITDQERFGEIRFHGGRFWEYQGSAWDPMDDHVLRKLIADQYGTLNAARKASDHKGIVDTIQHLVAKPLRTADTRGVNFANGVLMLDGSMKDHDEKYGFTYTLPFRYVPEEAGRAFKFQKFIDDCWSKDADYEQKKKALQEALCATIFGIGPQYQRAVLLHGVPKSGKSQMLTIASSLVPETAKAVCPPDTWSDKFAPASMYEKLINVCGELSEKKMIDGQRFKGIVAGETIDAQFKGKPLFKFNPVCTHWFASNHLPRTDDTSSAFNRRWLVLTFNHPISGEEVIRGLGEIIVAEEREAIAAWAVEALGRLLAQNEYTLPASHEEMMTEVSYMNESVRYFLLGSGIYEVTPRSPDGSKTSAPISEDTLHMKYSGWCLSGATGARPVGLRMFRQRMREIARELGLPMRMLPTAQGTAIMQYGGITPVVKQAA